MGCCTVSDTITRPIAARCRDGSGDYATSGWIVMAEGSSLSIAWIGAGLFALLTVLLLVLASLLDRTGPIRVRHWVENAGGRLRILFDRTERFEAYRYLLGFLARAAPVVLMAILVAVSAAMLPTLRSALLWSLAAVLFLVLIAEALSRLLAVRAEPCLDRLTFAYRGFLLLLSPLLPLAAPLFASHEEEEGETISEEEDEASDDEIEAFLDVGTKEGILEPGDEYMILRMIDFGDEVVRSVMTPRIDMVCASISTPLDELAALFVESNHSRIPLFQDSVDDIRGVLHIRDLLGALHSATLPTIESIALPPLFVPETKQLADLLRELQASHKHLALVVDEYGGTAGLVTIEDLLEEIVGEIVDEHDEDEPEVQRLKDGSYRLDGMTSLDALGVLFGVDLEDEPYETVGGMIFGSLGDLPEPGSKVTAHGLEFTVENVDDRRVDLLRVSRVVVPEGPAADEPTS
jgi:CBS domain containing-hemolysin-like protein